MELRQGKVEISITNFGDNRICQIVTVKRDRRQEKVRKLGSAMAESPEGLRKRLQELDSMLQSSDMAAESAAQAQVPRRPFLA